MYVAKYEYTTPRFPSEWKEKRKFLPTAPYPKTQKETQEIRKYDRLCPPPRTFIQCYILSSSVAVVFTKIVSPAICIAIAVANVCEVNQIRASTNP